MTVLSISEARRLARLNPDTKDSPMQSMPPDLVWAQLPVQEYSAPTGLEDDAPGSFEAIVTTFNRRVEGAFYDQRLRRSCFDASLAAGWPSVIWSHDWDTPPIGSTLSIREDGDSLIARAQLFVREGDDHPKAREVYTAMRGKHGDGTNVLREFSVGFRIEDAEWAEDGEDDEVLEITQASLHEYGPCLRGRNVSRLLGVYAAGGDTRFSGDPSADPILQRFPRPSGRRHADTIMRRRELLLARSR